jgi:hypothetical protein
MNKNNKVYSPESISAFVRQFQDIRILLTAYELEIFSRIGKSALVHRFRWQKKSMLTRAQPTGF